MYSIVIPAYNPNDSLAALVNELVKTPVEKIIVINDGSKSDCLPIFNEIQKNSKVIVLTNGINMGKGAALKVGLNYAYVNFRHHIGVITADADGQHLTKDILNVYKKLEENSQGLIVGCRVFHGKVPLRSKFGNLLTKKLFALLIGKQLSDTQSGLRGIPMSFIPQLLKVNSNGYEFELDMLILCKLTQRKIIEEPISTVYLDNNSSSHFNPLLDSFKIYFVLFRFTLLSLATYAIDYVIFFISHLLGNNLLLSLLLGRMGAILFNYPIVKKQVFCSGIKNSRAFSKYMALVLISGIVSYAVIGFLNTKFGISIPIAKILAESVIFLANFTIQRDFIFLSEQKYAN